MTAKAKISRRTALKSAGKLALVGGSGILFSHLLSGCGNPIALSSSDSNNNSGDSGYTTGDSGDTDYGTTDSCLSEIPSETAGPYPAHDDSAINCLRISGIQRSDIRSSLGAGGYSGTATASGVALTLTITLQDASTCTRLSGYSIYLWHCDRNGKYSMYSSGLTQETYLRGVQSTNENGQVIFTTIFPGCYDGRMPHMHFEIFQNINQAVDNGNVIKTSQLGFPVSTCNSVYSLSTYSTSKTNLSRISFATDNVFSDGYSLQVVSISGDNTNGYTATLTVAI